MIPTGAQIFAATDATWPAARTTRIGPYTLRAGQGGGSRVSAASCDPNAPADALIAHLAEAERWMVAQGQALIFQVREGDDRLDAVLEARGYAVKDPVVGYIAPVQSLTVTPLKLLRTFRIWPPVAIQREIWAGGGIGPERLSVMARAAGPKVALMGRAGDTPCACAFVACDGPIAMLHALETAPSARRQGLGRDMLVAAGHWAVDHGATHVALLVTRANVAANALYVGMGMTPATYYHYRIKAAS